MNDAQAGERAVRQRVSRSMVRPLTLALPAFVVLVAACSGSSTSTGALDGGDVSSSGNAGSSGTSGAASTGCAWGLPTCGGACVDTSEDARHCGACDNACSSGSVCVGGVCTVGTCEAAFLTTCGTSCVATSRHPDNCGACGMTCAAGSLCLDKVCTPQVGSGESCADPLVMRLSKQDEAFTFAGARADQAPLSCGDPQARPDRAFRWTATADHEVKARVVGGLATDDLVVEVFSDASCSAASSVSCNNDRSATDRRPSALFQGKAGKTYLIVVSSFGPPPAGRFYLHVDD